MIAWLWKHKLWGFTLLIIPFAFLLRGFGSIGGRLLGFTKPAVNKPIVYDEDQAESDRAEILEEEANEERIIEDEAKAECDAIDDWAKGKK